MADETAPHGAALGPLFPPAFHRPWLRYVDPVDGAEGGTGEQATTTPTTPQGDPEEKREIDWKAEARKHEARAKENLARAKANEEAAKRLAEIEEANKTEAEKTAERLAKLEAENQSYKQREQQATWRAEVAKATGVPADVLRGSTLEEIQAHAETLKPLLTGQAATKDAPVPTVGQTPANPGAVPLREQIAAAEKAGNRELVAALKAMQLGSSS